MLELDEKMAATSNEKQNESFCEWTLLGPRLSMGVCIMNALEEKKSFVVPDANGHL